MRKSIVRLILALVLAFVGVFAISQSASALTFKSADCIPGPCSGAYYSSDGHAMAGADVNPDGLSRITWYTDGSVDIQTNMADISSDGNGPLLLVKYCTDIVTYSSCRMAPNFLHLTTGGDTFAHIHHTYLAENYPSMDSIQLRMCNGVDGNNNPIHCESSWHGPFHP